MSKRNFDVRHRKSARGEDEFCVESITVYQGVPLLLSAEDACDLRDDLLEALLEAGICPDCAGPNRPSCQCQNDE